MVMPAHPQAIRRTRVMYKRPADAQLTTRAVKAKYGDGGAGDAEDPGDAEEEGDAEDEGEEECVSHSDADAEHVGADVGVGAVAGVPVAKQGAGVVDIAANRDVGGGPAAVGPVLEVPPEEKVAEFAKNDFCYIHGLTVRDDLNGSVVKLGDLGDDGRWEGYLLPHGSEIARLKSTNMRHSNEKAIMNRYKHDVVINGIEYTVHGTPQGGKIPLIIVRTADAGVMRGKAQFGMVTSKVIGSLSAFNIAISILDDMKKGEVACTKEQFTAHRDLLMNKLLSD
jgi:hypothetical protein